MRAQSWSEIPVAVVITVVNKRPRGCLIVEILTAAIASKQTRGCCGGLCTLCNEKVHSYHSHPESLAVELCELLHNVANISTRYKSCICKACELNLRGGIKCLAAGNPYVPRWEKSTRR